jgi:CheY-like chemotaxis protein
MSEPRMPQTVLIADSDPTALALMTAVLTRDGFTVVSTPDGGDALARFLEEPTRLVLCAHTLSGLSGSELCRRIKAQHPDTRVVVVHPGAGGVDALGLRGEIGCDAVLGLPFRYGELKKLLSSWQLGASAGAQSLPGDDARFRVPPSEHFKLPPPVALPQELVAVPIAGGGLPAAAPVGGGDLPLPIPLPVALAPELPEDEPAAASTEAALPELVIDEVLEETGRPTPAAPARLGGTGAAPAAAPRGPAAAASTPRPPSAAPTLGVPEQGDLAQVPLPRLFYRLYLATFTGGLRLVSAASQRTVYFSGGLPVHVESQSLDESLGRILLDHGRITIEQYTASLAVMQQRGVRHGEALVDMGILSEPELLAALKQQVELKVVNTFAWREGGFRLEPGNDFARGRVLSEVNPLAAIWRGVHENYELDALLGFFVEHQKRFVVATELFPVYYDTLGPFLRDLSLLAHLDGRTTFARALQSDPRTLVVAQALYVLLVTDMVRASDNPGEPAKLPAARVGRAGSDDPAAVSRLADEISREYLRIKDSDYLDVLRVDPAAAPEDVDAAHDNIVRALCLDALPAGLSPEWVRRAGEIRELLDRARAVVRDPTLRDRYLLAQQEKFATTAAPGEAAEPDEPTPARPQTLELDGHNRATSVEAQQAFLKGQGFILAGQFDKAIEKLQEAIRADAREPSYRVALAQAVLRRTGTNHETARAQAVTCLQQALQLDPAHIDANFEMAKLLLATGNKDRAFAYVQRVLQKAPGHIPAKRLLAQLG